MPVKPIDFGKPYPRLEDVQTQEGIGAKIIDGYIDPVDGSYVKRVGLTLFADYGAAYRIDGLYETIAGKLLSAVNGTISDIDADGTIHFWTGNGPTAGNRVSWCENDQNYIFIAAGAHPIQLIPSTRVGTVLAGNSPGQATHIAYSDKYLLANDLSASVPGDEFYSDGKGTHDYSSSDSWEYFNNEAAPDSCTGVVFKRNWNENYALGPKTIEISQDTGDINGPWGKLPVPPLAGVIAPWSFIECDDNFFYLSMLKGWPRVVMIAGRTPVEISSPYDNTLKGLSTLSDAYALPVVMKGIPFYVITFVTGNLTLAFNCQSKTWTQFGFWNGSSYDRHLANCLCYHEAWNKQFVGTRRTDGKVYELTGVSDEGSAIRMELTSGGEDRGTTRRKVCQNLRFFWKVGNAANTFKYQFQREDGTWSSQFTIGPESSDGDLYSARLNLLGAYRKRFHRVIHDSASYDFVLKIVEEEYKILPN